MLGSSTSGSGIGSYNRVVEDGRSTQESYHVPPAERLGQTEAASTSAPYLDGSTDLPGNHAQRRRRRKKKPGVSSTNKDLLLGPKRGWSEQQNVVLTRRFHEEMLRKAKSSIGEELHNHERRLKRAAKLFDQTTAKDKARAFQEKMMSEENKRLLKRLLKIEMQETEITKTNAPGCPEKVRFRRQRLARKKALRASKQFALDKINRENAVLLQRLRKARGSLNSSKWEEDFNRHKKQGRLMSRMRHITSDKKHRKRRGHNRNAKAGLHHGQSGSMSLPQLGSPTQIAMRQHLAEKQQQSHAQHRELEHARLIEQHDENMEHMIASNSLSSSSSALPPLPNSPESNANPLKSVSKRAGAEAERQRLLGVFGSLTSSDLRRRLERYASLLSPHLSIAGFRQMVRDLPKPVLVRTLVDVVQSAPTYSQNNS